MDRAGRQQADFDPGPSSAASQARAVSCDVEMLPIGRGAPMRPMARTAMMYAVRDHACADCPLAPDSPMGAPIPTFVRPRSLPMHEFGHY